MFLVQFFGKPNDQTMTFIAARIFSTCLAYTNSCVNPVLYAFLSDNFRKSFRKLLACRLRRSDAFEHPMRMHDTRSISGVGGGGHNHRRCSTTAVTAAAARTANGQAATTLDSCESRRVTSAAVGVVSADRVTATLLKRVIPEEDSSLVEQNTLATSTTYICTDC